MRITDDAKLLELLRCRTCRGFPGLRYDVVMYGNGRTEKRCECVNLDAVEIANRPGQEQG